MLDNKNLPFCIIPKALFIFGVLPIYLYIYDFLNAIDIAKNNTYVVNLCIHHKQRKSLCKCLKTRFYESRKLIKYSIYLNETGKEALS